jgi:hypothetical protein
MLDNILISIAVVVVVVLARAAIKNRLERSKHRRLKAQLPVAIEWEVDDPAAQGWTGLGDFHGKTELEEALRQGRARIVSGKEAWDKGYRSYVEIRPVLKHLIGHSNTGVGYVAMPQVKALGNPNTALGGDLCPKCGTPILRHTLGSDGFTLVCPRPSDQERSRHA